MYARYQRFSPWRTPTRLSRRLVVALAFASTLAAVGVPSSAAAPARSGPALKCVRNALDNYCDVTPRSADARSTSAGRYGTLDPWAYAAIHSSKASATVGASGIDSSDGGGFAWGAFLIGIATALGAVLFVAALALTARRQRSSSRRRIAPSGA